MHFYGWQGQRQETLLGTPLVANELCKCKITTRTPSPFIKERITLIHKKRREKGILAYVIRLGQVQIYQCCRLAYPNEQMLCTYLEEKMSDSVE